MKKSFRIMAASGALLLTAGILTGAALAGMNADLNGDGAANRSDAVMLTDVLLGKPSSRMTKDMDQNGDGVIDARDLSVLKSAILNPKQTVSGKEPKLPATMYSNFRSGDAGDFFSSDGWTNGKPFDCWWYKQNAQIKGDHLELTISDNYQNKGNPDWQPSYSGGEFRTNKYYHYGYYETSMKAIKNDGVVSSFFTYTGPSDNNPWDEIDIEILGKDTTKAQFNYYTDGVGNHEYMYDLGFDASEAYHTYGFDWQADHITWYVDGKEAYTMWGNVPKTPGKIMMNTWPGVSDPNKNPNTIDWLKPYNGKTPLTAHYQWVTYNK